jgi:hypothetical protein
MGEFHDKTTEDDFVQDELINVKLPRSKYEVLRKMIEREETWNWLQRWLANNWIFIIGGGLLSLIILWEKVQHFVMGSK